MLQISDSLQTTPTYYEPDCVSQAPDQHRLRVLIDEIATTRGLTIQMSLRLMMLAAGNEDDDYRLAREEFCALADQFDRNIELIFGQASFPDYPADRIDWIRRIASGTPSRKINMLSVQTAIAELRKRIGHDTPLSYVQARQFNSDNWPIVRDEMTALIWDLWADLDNRKNTAVGSAKKLSETLVTTLSEIKKISMTVRMIALNTAVLASKAGDKGAGFSVIASEVKKLAEAIQSSADRADSVVSEMKDNEA
ncbi:hypothetical protein KX928_21990 [Roseobacter sp. YSTF-M11]|uniref:Methyl-accepting transducer domain-containing protein n=1 Tax=Roseobacter insulae TaxID=2859783 RepID=A0A9X1G0L1_9RHOB|nr:methyl-accepting chemotaxis protein [Roseobacter insulae]MBW4710470.1 hypothetical protein [Roseobacter insulae]